MNPKVKQSWCKWLVFNSTFLLFLNVLGSKPPLSPSRGEPKDRGLHAFYKDSQINQAQYKEVVG